MRALLGIVIILLTSTAASGAELSLLGGYRTGGPSVELGAFNCVTQPCPEPAIEARDGESLGLILDLPINDRWMFEILLNYQSVDLVEKNLAFITIYPPVLRPSSFDITHLHFGFQRQWQGSKASPFVAAGLGVSQLEADKPLFSGDAIDEDRLSASLAGGIKFQLNKWLGARVEGRGYWTDAPDSLDEDVLQLDFSAGLSFKF